MKGYSAGGGGRRTFSRRGPIFAGLVLILFLFSTQGVGFIIHILEETADDACCRSSLGCESRGPSQDVLGALILTGPAQTGHHHDASTCVICGQFLNCVFVALDYGPAWGLPVPFSFETVPAPIHAPAPTEIIPYNLRAPPLGAQA
jgi:hypothetical protein